MRTLKNEWIRIISSILNGEKSNKVDNYLEITNVSACFLLNDNFYDLYSYKHVKENYSEMKKVFFSNESNSFGHNYSNSIINPAQKSNNHIESICEILKEDINSRRALLTFQPYGKNKVPCINTVQFLIRDNQLNIIYNSRGQDIYNKFAPDVMCISNYAVKISERLNIPLGSMTCNIASCHIYEKDLEKAFEIVKDYNKNIILYSSNEKKYELFKPFLKKHNINMLVKKIDIPEIQNLDYKEVAKAKAKALYEYFGYPVWTDDLSLVTKAFENFPGYFTKHLFKCIPIESLKNLFLGKPLEAKMICILCCYDGISYHTVEGINNGKLNFDNKIKDNKMPLSSLFEGEGELIHRQRALQQLIDLKMSGEENT